VKNFLIWIDGACISAFVLSVAVIILFTCLLLLAIAEKIIHNYPAVAPSVLATILFVAVVRGGYLYFRKPEWR